MSTRSRRSAGQKQGTALNPTLIQLLGVARLREELRIRGLDTTGNKTILADRLEEAVLLGKAVADEEDVKPLIEAKEEVIEQKPAVKTKKVVTPKPKRGRAKKNVPEEVEAAEPATEEAEDSTQNVEQDSEVLDVEAEAPEEEAPVIPVANTRSERIKRRSCRLSSPVTKTTAKRGSIRGKKAAEQVEKAVEVQDYKEEPMEVDKVDEPAVELPKKRRRSTRKSTQKIVDVDAGHSKGTEGTEEVAEQEGQEDDQVQSGEDQIKDKVEKQQARKDEAEVEIVEEFEDDIIVASPPKVTKVARKSKMTILSVTTKTSDGTVKKIFNQVAGTSVTTGAGDSVVSTVTSKVSTVTEAKSCQEMTSEASTVDSTVPKVKPLSIKVQKSKEGLSLKTSEPRDIRQELKIITLDDFSPSSSAGSTPTPSDMKERSSQEKSHESRKSKPALLIRKISKLSSSTGSPTPGRSSKIASPVTAGVPRKRTIPQRHAPAGIDLLDSILGSQDALLKECNKTEQEKANELQKFELEKRRISGQSPFLLGPLEKRPRTNTMSSNESQPNSPLPNVNPRDPLNIMTVPTTSSTPAESQDLPGVERSADRLKRLELPGQRKVSQISPLATKSKYPALPKVPLSPPKLVSPSDLAKIKTEKRASRWETPPTKPPTTVPSPAVTFVPLQPAPSAMPFLPPPPGFPFPPPFPPPVGMPGVTIPPPGMSIPPPTMTLPGLPPYAPYGLPPPFIPSIPPPALPANIGVNVTAGTGPLGTGTASIGTGGASYGTGGASYGADGNFSAGGTRKNSTGVLDKNGLSGTTGMLGTSLHDIPLPDVIPTNGAGDAPRTVLTNVIEEMNQDMIMESSVDRTSHSQTSEASTMREPNSISEAYTPVDDKLAMYSIGKDNAPSAFGDGPRTSKNEAQVEVPTNECTTLTVDDVSCPSVVLPTDLMVDSVLSSSVYNLDVKEEQEETVRSVEDVVKSVILAIVEEVTFEIEHASSISASARMRLHDSLLDIDSEDVYEPDVVNETICVEDDEACTSELHIDVDFDGNNEGMTTVDSQEEYSEDEIAGEDAEDSEFDSEDEDDEGEELEVDEEGRVKKKTSKLQVDIPKENGAPEENQEESTIQALMKDPRNLLKRADILIKSFNNKSGVEIEQMELDEDYVVEEPAKPMPEFHGEPVPDEDDDDALFEMAAGMSRKKEGKPIEEERLPDDECIELDYYNADMNIKADPKNKWLVDPDNGDGFALMWGCVRSNYGLIIPKDVEGFPTLVYQVKIGEFITLKHLPFEEVDAYDLRVGWSSESVQTPVGEAEHSYCYSRLGRKAAGNLFLDFGAQALMDDVITVALNLELSEMRVYLNQQDLGVVYKNLDFGAPDDAIFPHIGIKNMKLYVNFGLEQPEPDCKWELPPQLLHKNVKFIGQLERSPSILKRSIRPPDSKSDCTVLMMVGLPAAGKTFWVRHYLREHPNEHWVLLNTENVINLMKVNGVPRKRVHNGRWDMIMGLAAKALNRSFGLACRRRHNYIIDQTNVSRDARKRKLQVFNDFLRKCVVIVPPADEFEHRQLRQARQETGSTLPAEALLELKATFALPAQDQEPIEEVIFVEPPIERVNEAIELIQRYNEEGRPYLRTKRYNNKPPPSVISDNRNQPLGSW
ncbi:unnamed protein product [Bursaphelenchus okinawaensis]|uniref:SAP domain-containing protein n=1 Tax=Bursaphelenchus okinawaensis TaxID=465554 RepID=A0A811JRF1_9BILA|nr:unnamed protein product [Bursaphelenchus okinawaensis]CAG9079619.1 unnamed protein product [Bursaphelenchus okinawaensis]